MLPRQIDLWLENLNKIEEIANDGNLSDRKKRRQINHWLRKTIWLTNAKVGSGLARESEHEVLFNTIVSIHTNKDLFSHRLFDKLLYVLSMRALFYRPYSAIAFASKNRDKLDPEILDSLKYSAMTKIEFVHGEQKFP